MFEEIAGLPAHPLFVHAAVVSVPVLALLAALHALVPVARERAEAPLIALAVAAPLSVAIARESGAALQRRLIDTGATPPSMLSEIQAHADRSGTLLLLTLALSVASAASVTLYRARDTESKSGPSPSGPTPVPLDRPRPRPWPPGSLLTGSAH
jgi:hypothetical protein